MGLCKEEWGLSPRAWLTSLNDGDSKVGPWDTAPAKPWQARRMAVYAAMIEIMDRGVGRIMTELQRQRPRRQHHGHLPFRQRRLSGAGPSRTGTISHRTRATAGRSQVGNQVQSLPGPETVYQSYGPAWANASNTPLRRFKHFTEEGGISTPFVVRWPGDRETGRANSARSDWRRDRSDADRAGRRGRRAIRRRTTATPFWPEEGMNLAAGNRRRSHDSASRAALLGARGKPSGAHRRLETRSPLTASPGSFTTSPPTAPKCTMSPRTYPEIVRELHIAYDAWEKRVGVEEWPIPD